MHDSREPTGLCPVLQDAQRLASSGRTIFPCKPDKTPLVAWKRAATTDPATIQNWWKRWPDAMIGLPTGHGLAVFDIDVDKATGKTFGEATARRMGLWELIRQGLLVNTPSGGLHAYFAGDVATSTGTIGPGIDTRGRGGYVIAPGSVNAHGTYRWETLCLTDVALPPLPGGLSDALSMERSFGVAGKLDQARSGAPPSLAGADEVREILSWIDPDAGGYDQWCKVLMGLHDHFAGSEEGLSIAEGWSSHGAKFRPREVPAKWASFQSGAGISIRTICEIARSNGADLALVARKHRAYGLSADSTQPERLRPASALSAHPATADAPGPSDDALALSFAAVHVSGLRFVAPWGRWMVWTGKRWRPDESLAAFDLVRAICRKAAEQCDKPGRAAALASAKTVAAVERLAKADRRLAATTDQWDADRWLLNTPDGAVDLKTGKQRPHEWGDYLTRMTAVSPHGGCPTWLRFLDDVCGGDDALTAYLKRLAGYALTGSTREQNLAFLHGTGGNGKV